jgi:hypothetical protein
VGAGQQGDSLRPAAGCRSRLAGLGGYNRASTINSSFRDTVRGNGNDELLESAST